MKINKFFPTIIGTATNENHSNIDKKLIDKCYSLQKEIKSGGENWILILITSGMMRILKF